MSSLNICYYYEDLHLQVCLLDFHAHLLFPIGYWGWGQAPQSDSAEPEQGSSAAWMEKLGPMAPNFRGVCSRKRCARKSITVKKYFYSFDPGVNGACIIPRWQWWQRKCHHCQILSVHYLWIANVCRCKVFTRQSQKSLPGTAHCPADHPFPADRGNPPDPLMPSDPHRTPGVLCEELIPGEKGGRRIGATKWWRWVKHVNIKAFGWCFVLPHLRTLYISFLHFCCCTAELCLH